jgi:hypothetical protein
VYLYADAKILDFFSRRTHMEPTTWVKPRFLASKMLAENQSAFSPTVAANYNAARRRMPGKR